MPEQPLHKKPAVVVTIVLACLGIFFAWSAREWIGWQLVSTEVAPVEVGPARLAVPESLPARMVFGANGDVKLIAGEINYDAMALSLRLMPTGGAFDDEDASTTLKRLQLALLADEPHAKLVERQFGKHPGFVSRTKVGKATSILVVAVAGGALARVEIAVRGAAPAKWLKAADVVVDSFALDDEIESDGLWSVFAERALDACDGGDVAACVWTAKSTWQRGLLDDAELVLDKGLARAGPIEALWDEVNEDLLATIASAAMGKPAPAAVESALSSTSAPVTRLGHAVELHLLRGELEVARGKPVDAVEIWRRAWRFDADGRVAQRLLEEGAALVDEKSAPAWAELARDADERFGERPAVAIAAARVTSKGGRYDDAKAIAQRVYDAHDDDEVRREIVTVPLSAPKKALKDVTLPCPRGTRPDRIMTGSGTITDACVDRAGKKQGPGVTWFGTTGYVLEEVTYRDNEVGPPDRRYWENGALQRESLVDANGGVTVKRWDPFGRPIGLEEGAPPSDAAVDVETP